MSQTGIVGNKLPVSDIAYGVSRNGVTTVAPSKNAVYDKIETLVSGGAGNLFVSTSQPLMNNGSVYTITHNLNVTQADVEDGRYLVMFSFKNGSSAGSLKYIPDDSNADVFGNYQFWLATDPTVTQNINRQANTLKVFSGNNGAKQNVRVIIKSNR